MVFHHPCGVVNRVGRVPKGRKGLIGLDCTWSFENKRLGVIELILAEYLSQRYEEVFFDEFYREIFQDGCLPEWTSEDPKVDYPSGNGKWHYVGIAMEQLPEFWEAKEGQKPRRKTKRHYVYNDLAAIHELVEDPVHKDNFCFMAPVSYVGSTRKNANARQMFALCIEIDDLKIERGTQEGMRSLLLDIDQEYSPRPTFILCSGSGVHLYYVFETPVNLFPSIFKQMQKLKRDLTKRLWNRRVTTSYEKIQYEGICQPFRILGTVTKKGEKTRAFRTGEKIDVEYLNSFVKEPNRVFLHYEKYQRAAGVTPLPIAKEKWPEWNENVVERQRAGKKPKRRSWTTNRALYDSFLDRIPYEARVGHRYNSLLVLASCAVKCKISKEEFEADCWRLWERLDFDEDKPFTEQDVRDVVKAYKNNELTRMTVEAAAALSGITLKRDEKRRRGKDRIGRDAHLEIARAIQSVKCRQRGRDWREGNGRPKGSGTAQQVVLEWQKNNPGGTKKQCKDATGLTYPTIRKWWDSISE